MSSEFDAVDDAQLEQLAFGRQGRVYDRELAEAALRELARRGAARGPAASPGSASADPDAVVDPAAADDNADTVAADRHRRRIRATGIAAVTAAALALVGIAPLISAAPLAGDPFAIFERPATADDEAWGAQLTRDQVTGITLGPRTADLGDGLTAVVFRSAATVDGRSTAFDPYCLFVAESRDDGELAALSGTCALPERFATEGLRLDLRPSAQGGGLDVVTWGPTGGPRLNQYQSPAALSGVRSVLDWLVFPSGAESDLLAIVDEPDQLLMGPSNVPLLAAEGVAALDSQTWAYLREGQSGDGPVLCVVTLVIDPTADQLAPLETRTCAPLATVTRQGLAQTVTSAGRDWEIVIGPDGEGRSDRVRPADAD